jgi:hypothetical protein
MALNGKEIRHVMFSLLHLVFQPGRASCSSRTCRCLPAMSQRGDFVNFCFYHKEKCRVRNPKYLQIIYFFSDDFTGFPGFKWKFFFVVLEYSISTTEAFEQLNTSHLL